jgi:hypothetical protein
MATLRRRPTGNDDDLRRQIDELLEEREAFLAEHALLAEDAHHRIDEALGECLARAQQLAAEHRHKHGWPLEPVDAKVAAFSPVPWPAPYFEVAALHYAGTDAGFRKMLHDAVDAKSKHGAPEFSPLTRKEYEAKLEKIRQAVDDRERELARREVERRREELEAELQALDGATAESEEIPVA